MTTLHYKTTQPVINMS